MIRQNLKGAKTKEELAGALSGRLDALASAHALVLRDGPVGNETIDLNQLVAEVIKPHDLVSAFGKPRIKIRGPALICNGQNGSSIALVFNKLATNAAKYGSLSGARGSVDISWIIKQNTVHIQWTEHDGPSVTPPAKAGFGSKLVEVTVVRQHSRKPEFDWRAAGLAVSISLPLNTFKID